jgi:hypothetical protein
MMRTIHSGVVIFHNPIFTNMRPENANVNNKPILEDCLGHNSIRSREKLIRYTRNIAGRRRGFRFVGFDVRYSNKVIGHYQEAYIVQPDLATP